MIKLSEDQLKEMGITEEVYKVARQLAQEHLEKYANKTWIVVEWEYLHYTSYYSRKRQKYIKDRYDETPYGKKAKKIYCIETQEFRDI